MVFDRMILGNTDITVMTAFVVCLTMAVTVLVPMGAAMWWKRRQEARDRRKLDVRTNRLMTSGGAS